MMGRNQVLLISALVLLSSWILVTKVKRKEEVELRLTNFQQASLITLFSTHSSLLLINPTIISYTLLSNDSRQVGDDGSVTEWRLTYEEHLVYLPFIKHEADAVYEIYHNNQPTQPLTIISRHTTQVLGLSLETKEVTTIKLNGNQEGEGESSALITSTVHYECPLLLGFYCGMEFRAQRDLIHTNIRHHTQSTKI